MYEQNVRRAFLLAIATACFWQVLSALNFSLKPPVDVFAGRPFTLECKITRLTGDRSVLTWTRDVGQTSSAIYSSGECTSSIAVSSAGLSGGCQQVDDKEVYTLTIENVTEDTGRGTWICRYGSSLGNVTLDVQVLSDDGLSVTPPGAIVAGRPYNLQCKMNRLTGDKSSLSWYRINDRQNQSLIYSLSECKAQVSSTSPGEITGRCEKINGEEVYTLRIASVTESMGQDKWRCENSGRVVEIRLHIQVMVTSVTLTGTPSSLLAGDAHTFNCMTSPSQPPACITWYIRTSGYVRELDRDDCNKDSSYTVATSRRLSFTASAADNGAELYCNASNSVTNVPVQSQVYELKVNYTPEITCDQTHVTVFQGQEVNISCKVKANPIARVTWAKNRLNNAFTSTHDPTQRDVILSTSKIEITKAMTSGVYEIEATNSAGSSRAEVEFTVIDNQKIPKNLKTISCINNQATLVWPSGINSSLVEYYKLEYKGNGEEWKQKLIRNPGRVKLVETTLNDLQSGVLYQFRLQPDSDIALPEYAKAECTMENAGLSTAEMFGVGFAVGFVVLAILVVAVACFLRRRAKKKLALN